MPPTFCTSLASDQCQAIPHESSHATPSAALDACVPAKPSRAFGLHCFLCVVCQARLGPPGCYPCRIHRTHGPFGKSSILLFKPVATVKSFLATVCASSLTVLYPYIEQRQGQASSNHRVGLRSRRDLKSRSRKRRPTRLQVMQDKSGQARVGPIKTI
jgi:hypothetical protein